MKKVILPISEGGAIEVKNICKHKSGDLTKVFKWQINVSDTSFWDSSSKGEYYLSLNQKGEKLHNFAIENIVFTNTKNISITSDGKIKIGGDGTINFDVKFTIPENEINSSENFGYTIQLTKAGENKVEESALFTFNLKNSNVFCEKCIDNHNRGFCRIEGVNSIEYIGNDNSKNVKVADIVISPVKGACENDSVILLYNNKNIDENGAAIPASENDDIQVKYGNVLCSCYIQHESTEDGCAKIPVPQETEIRVPVYACNLPPIAENTSELTISANIKYATCENISDVVNISAKVEYKQSAKLNKLKVSIKDPNKDEEYISQGETVKKNIYIGEGKRTYTFFIKNEATELVDSNCAIHVRNIKRTIVPADYEGRFVNKDFNPANVWNFEDNQTYSIHNNNSDVVKIGGENVCNQAKHIEIPFVIEYDKIGDINIKDHSRSVDIKAIIEFEYKADKLVKDINSDTIVVDNNESEYLPYKIEFLLNVERKSITEWHALDFGTSAVVEIKSKNWKTEEIANLRQKKHQLLLDAYPTKADECKRLDIGEENAENLIASTIYVNPASTGLNDATESNTQGKAAEYRVSPLWFSPSSEMPNPNDRLPCIKNLVGNEKLPQIAGANTNGLDVKTIVGIAYEQLCKYYLNDEEIEGLILTVPNSFTPMHIKKIREIVMNEISTLQEDKLMFISESDAVLWSYIKKTRNNIPEFRKSLKETRNNIERILIFDMGAGTLDISYAECKDQCDDENKFKCEIDIKAKIGVNKAGNYIDYLLGEIILKIMGEKGVTTEQWNKFAKALSISNSVAPTGYSEKKMLRNYLRNVVKVNLDENNKAATLPPVNPSAADNKKYDLFDNGDNYEILKDITIGDILEDELFKDFINSCTHNLLKELAEKHGDIANDTDMIDKKIIVDTIILSGRTTSLPGISKNIKEAIGKYTTTTNPDYFTLKDVITAKLGNTNVVDGRIYFDNDIDSKKTVVAQGALNYLQLALHNKGYEIINKERIYGCYGLLYMNGAQVFDWEALIDEKDYMDDTKNVYDSKTNTYNKKTTVDVCELGITQILLCHTYNVNPLEAAQNNNYDSITILGEKNSEEDTVNVELKITKTGKIEIGFNGDFETLQPHDDYSNSTLRKSLWPVVYK